MSISLNAHSNIVCLSLAPAARAAVDLKINHFSIGGVATRVPPCLR
jgi:hypothetical protein